MSTSTCRAAGLLLCVCLGLLGCWSNMPKPSDSAPEEPDGPVWFEDVTDAVGLDFVHDPGRLGNYFMPEMMGSGCTFIHDADGTLYIYLLQNGGPESKSVNRLYRVSPDGSRVQDVTSGSGLDVAGYNMGVAVADVNNDGLPDVLLTQYGGIKLFLNLGGGHFEDVTEEAGLSNPISWATSAAFFDYDRDGWLDLIVVNYLEYNASEQCRSPRGERSYCTPPHFPYACNKLFHNLGPVAAANGKPAARVHFEDVSFESGIGSIAGPGLGVVCADFDGDGWPDVFIANDGEPNRLWINRHNGKFVDEAASRNLAFTMTGKAFAGMGVAIGDVENRGMLDLYVTHLSSESNTLWKQGPRGQFHDRTVESGLANARWRGTGFGTLMADFDLDGSLDLVVVNGRVLHGSPAKNTNLGYWETYAERNQLFANDGTGKFRDLSVANKPFCGAWNVARGLACADFNHDGAPDLLMTTVGNRARLFRNVAPNRGHWLQVRAIDPKLKRDAYGAEVLVRAGDRKWLRLINPAESYLCSSSPVAQFGLGKVEQIDSILVNWPDGNREAFDGGAVDRAIKLEKGKGHAP